MGYQNVAAPGREMPRIAIKPVSGNTPSLTGGGWKAVFVYRGAHCPMCRQYLTDLEALKTKFSDAGVAIVAVSADSPDVAESFMKDVGYTSEVGAGLIKDDMDALGLYISQHEDNSYFSEPAVFVVNPDGIVMAIDKSSAPFARPDISTLLSGIEYIQSLAT